MTNKPMTVIELTEVDGGLQATLDMMRSIVEFNTAQHILDLRVGIDPMDNGLKFSVDGGVWSPPARGIVTPPAVHLPRPRR